MHQKLLYAFLVFFTTYSAYGQEFQVEPTEKAVIVEGDTIIYTPDAAPVFPGGPTAIKEYFRQHLPDYSVKGSKKYDKNIWVSFVIRSSGRIGSTNFINSDKPDLNEKLNQALKSMPAWKPAVHQGKNVATIGDFNFYFD